MFDEEPDGDPHGECRAEIERLRAERDAATLDRNMISDLIMENPMLVVECAMDAHDAHSFWSDVRETHAAALEGK